MEKIRYTDKYLYEHEELKDSLFEKFNALFEKWRNNEQTYLHEFHDIFDVMPSEWVYNTYESRYRNIRWEDNEDKLHFAEMVVLPYCIEKRLVKQKKGGEYVYVGKNVDIMPELNFDS